MKNLILDAAGQLDLLLVLGFHKLCLLLNSMDLVVKDLDLLPCLLFLLRDRFLHVEVLLHLLGNEPVKLLYLALVGLVLRVSLLDNLVLLGDLGARKPILLLINRFDHFLNCLHGRVRSFEPFAVRVLQGVQVCIGGPDALLCLCNNLRQLLRILLEKVQLLDDLSFFLGE